jgi:signal transduction histidine kinase
LVALSLTLRLAHARVTSDPEGAAALLAEADRQLQQGLDELRELARGIRPAVLSDRGLRPALEALAARSPFPVELEAPDERFPSAVEVAVYFMVSEALTNAAKYAATGAVRVTVTRRRDRLVAEVADDGSGGADPAAGSGLRGLRDRVDALGGRLAIGSPRGRGTVVRAELPLGKGRASPNAFGVADPSRMSPSCSPGRGHDSAAQAGRAPDDGTAGTPPRGRGRGARTVPGEERGSRPRPMAGARRLPSLGP